MDYEEITKALRGLAKGTWRNSEYTWFGGEEKVFADAADAIQTLVSENAWNGVAVKHLKGEVDKVVHCKDCKWYSIYEAKKDGTPDKRYSPSVCLRGIYAKRRDPEWFCADGERNRDNDV